jgi:hypothetical protein
MLDELGDYLVLETIIGDRLAALIYQGGHVVVYSIIGVYAMRQIYKRRLEKHVRIAAKAR